MSWEVEVIAEQNFIEPVQEEKESTGEDVNGEYSTVLSSPGLGREGLGSTGKYRSGQGRGGQGRKARGFTDSLAVSLVCLLFAGLFMGFILAVLSIRYQYTGALQCFTVVFTPVGVGVSVVLGAVVQKNKAENTGPNNEGIKYTLATMDYTDSNGLSSEADV